MVCCRMYIHMRLWTQNPLHITLLWMLPAGDDCLCWCLCREWLVPLCPPLFWSEGPWLGVVCALLCRAGLVEIFVVHQSCQGSLSMCTLKNRLGTCHFCCCGKSCDGFSVTFWLHLHCLHPVHGYLAGASSRGTRSEFFGGAEWTVGCTGESC